ncbi:coproporphyrinogen III oxidase [Paenibacillus hexagrammi]|uniref:Coproporphyrinogen III oxidase n=1 Tax=Paenibacillus hexagrammi TaxID=2908839 RepID=A0ABY3SQZ5_9BACL|nr:coproporphyrinogen III oxidase [Paenibacillus sp. YPD9-1]UJF36419.1 coproporphyrinogen III oxidase [Paenibacillus sp. YPD9-1]
MEVSRTGFEELTTEILHIHRLFFEETEISYTSIEEADLRIKLELEVLENEDEGLARASALVRDTELPDEEWTAVNERMMGLNDLAGRKTAIRRAVCTSLLQALQQMTGLTQPWGILTGVRPTKLMHNLLQKHDRETCLQLLKEQHLVSDEKADLLVEVAERQLKVIPDLFHLDREVSVYIGIPFCPTKCAYCTFPAYDIRGNNGSVHSFLHGLHEEMRLMGKWMKEAGLRITTIYWGGGTPTSITAEEMDALFVTMHESFPDMSAVRELTVEAGRPDTITPDKIEVMKKWNVDRISINPQSFTQETLDAIGRHHTVEETIEKFKLARDMGLDNINMDLIIGLPNEGMKELEHSLVETEKLLPESLTVHTLSFKRASRMTKNREQYEVAERDEVAEMMERAIEWTTQHEYVPYYLYRQKNILGNLENVGYAFEGRESLYNILMMEERQTIIGLGCGAVSKILFARGEEQSEVPQRIERFPNPKEPSVYNQAYLEYIEKKIKLLDEAYQPLREKLTSSQ